MRNQNPKHKLDPAVTLLKTAVLWRISLFHRGIKRQVECYSADSAPLWSGGCTLLGSSLAEKGGWNEEVLEMMNRIEEKRDIASFPAWSAPGLTTLLQISPSAESHWCHDIVLNYETTSPCSSVHPLPPFLKSTALQPGVSATGRSKYARLFKELVIFIWNWPGRNGEGCQILGTPVPVFPGTDPSGSLFLVYHQLLSCS